MKRSKSPFRLFSLTSILAVALPITLLLVGSVNAQQKGASKLMKQITSSEDVKGLKDGDIVAMACPKCKTITLTHITTEKGHIKTTTPGEEHLCPGCEQKFVVVGEGKAKHDTITHICKKCGGKDAFCCVLRQGGEATKGMGEKLDVAPLK